MRPSRSAPTCLAMRRSRVSSESELSSLRKIASDLAAYLAPGTTAPDCGIEFELLPGTGHGDIEQVQLLIALLGREVGQPISVHGMQLLQAREVTGQPHPRPLQALGLVRRRQHPLRC